MPGARRRGSGSPNGEPPRKRIALIAHDHKKEELLRWVSANRQALSRYELLSTGTTGEVLRARLGLPVVTVESGPLGGDLQVGARIAQGEIDVLVFFWDPLEPQPHDPDVKALLRIAVVWNVPVACNVASADFLFSSPLMAADYARRVPDYAEYRERRLRDGGS